MPVPPLTGEFAASMCVDPSVHENTCGVIIGVPSTETEPEPVGLTVTVTATAG